MTQLSRPRSNHIGSVRKLSKLCFEHIAGADLFLFILPNWQWRNKLLAPPTVNEEEVFFADLHTQLLLRIVELTDPSTFGKCAQSKLSRVRASEFNDFKPCYGVGRIVRVAGSTFVVRSNNLGRRIKATLEALNQNGPERSRAEIRGQRFMSVKNAGIRGE